MALPNEKQSVLVLMSSYNGEKYIEGQIESIMNQKVDSELHLRIRDDGSKDKTCEIIEKISRKYLGKIELINGENKGYNASFFELLNGASGYDFYAISDQDDIWMQDKIQIAMNILTTSNESGPLLYASTSFLVEDDLNPYGTTRKKERDFSIYNTIIQNICPGHTQVLNNELLSIIQGDIDTKRIYVYDSWICNMAMLYGKILFDNEPHTFYRQHRGNQLGYGKGRIGRILTSVKHADAGDGLKYRRQIEYFCEQNKKMLVDNNCYCELTRFINANSFRNRLVFAIKNKFYRQSMFESVVFRVAVLIGKY